MGETGIEAFYEHYLHGHQGTTTLEVNSLGSVLGSIKTTEPVVGDSVVLNIDTPLEEELDHYLQSEILEDRHSIDPVSHKVPEALNGAAIVMNPNNGEVYAMASYPSYNLNSFVTGLSDSEYETAQKSGRLQQLRHPGSVHAGQHVQTCDRYHGAADGHPVRVSERGRHRVLHGARTV